MKSRQKCLAFLIALSICAVPLAAQAQRKSPLADAPAIRKRLELRSTRFELGAGASSTIGQDFFHSVLINVKAGFHVTDWLSLSLFGGFAVANISTGFESRVTSSLDPGAMGTTREPSASQAAGSMNKISQMFGAQLEFTPFTGKYSLFGKLFAHYDFYALIGAGLINFTAADSTVPVCADSANGGDPTRCAATGLKPAPLFGIGIHSYFNDFVALNFELRDMVVDNNPAGRDVNGDGKATSADLQWQSTYVATLSLVFVLPATAHISN